MRTRIIFFISVLLLMLTSHVGMRSQSILPAEAKMEFLQRVTEPWQDNWQTLQLEGKLKMEGLPLSPTLKIYMERDSVLICSVRAPLFGEVGRMEIIGDKFLLVNKMKKVYVSLSLADFSRFYPGSLSDFQDLLLGRMVMPGTGLLSIDNNEAIDVYLDEENRFAVVPSPQNMQEGYVYGYVVSEEFVPELLLVLPATEEENEIDINYQFNNNNYIIDAVWISPDKTLEAVLELKYPVFAPSPIEPMQFGNKYREVTISQFLKSF